MSFNRTHSANQITSDHNITTEEEFRSHHSHKKQLRLIATYGALRTLSNLQGLSSQSGIEKALSGDENPQLDTVNYIRAL